MLLNELPIKGFEKLFNSIPGNVSLKYHGCYRGPVYPGWKADAQINKDLHLLYVWGGDGCYYIEDGAKIPLRPGSLVFISHGVKHHAYVNSSNPLMIYGLRFGLYNDIGSDFTRTYAPCFYHYINTSRQQQYNDILTKIYKLYHSKKDHISMNMCSALLYQLLYELYEDLIEPSQNQNIDLKMEKACRYLEEHAYEKINIKVLASALNISTRYLEKRFKASYGYTPKEYHMTIQMNAAVSMIKEDNFTVAKVSEMLGYCDAFSFSKQFKKYFGYAPVKLKKYDTSKAL